jgi:hypothetical protein
MKARRRSNRITKKENKEYWKQVIEEDYTINQSMQTANIFHLYKKCQAYGTGFDDAMFFDLHCYNTDTGEKCIFTHHDAIFTETPPSNIKIFVDGSTMIEYKTPQQFDIAQAVTIG